MDALIYSIFLVKFTQLLLLCEFFYLDVSAFAKVQRSRSRSAFAKVLQTKCSTLKHLILGSRCFGTVGLKALVQALHTNCVLTNLVLSKYELDDEIVVALGEALEFNTTLTHLKLLDAPESVNEIGWSCVSPLARALKKNSTLKSLTLPFNEIEDRMDSKAEALADATQTISTLTQLDLSGICELETEAICEAPRFTHTQDSDARALVHAPQTVKLYSDSDLRGIRQCRPHYRGSSDQSLSNAFESNKFSYFIFSDGAS